LERSGTLAERIGMIADRDGMTAVPIATIAKRAAMTESWAEPSPTASPCLPRARQAWPGA
jgi:hypothetical protein